MEQRPISTRPQLIWKGKIVKIGKKGHKALSNACPSREAFEFRGAKLLATPADRDAFLRENECHLLPPPSDYSQCIPFTWCGISGEGRILRAIDGDTYDLGLLRDGTPFCLRIRLLGIDTYEKNTPMGFRCTEFVKSTFEGKDVIYYLYEADKYGRVLADIYINGICISQDLIARGFGVPYDGGKKTL
jgi:endonuclease YncB( thermonuclease family)